MTFFIFCSNFCVWGRRARLGFGGAVEKDVGLELQQRVRKRKKRKERRRNKEGILKARLAGREAGRLGQVREGGREERGVAAGGDSGQGEVGEGGRGGGNVDQDGVYLPLVLYSTVWIHQRRREQEKTGGSGRWEGGREGGESQTIFYSMTV